MKKTRDLYQEFDLLEETIQDFKETNTVEGMERVEIESLIQQVIRLQEKLDKFMKIVSSNY